MATRKAFLIEDLSRGYFTGIDNDDNRPCFDYDVTPTRDFDTPEEAEKKLMEMSEELREVEGIYQIVPVIIVY